MILSFSFSLLYLYNKRRLTERTSRHFYFFISKILTQQVSFYAKQNSYSFSNSKN